MRYHVRDYPVSGRSTRQQDQVDPIPTYPLQYLPGELMSIIPGPHRIAPQVRAPLPKVASNRTDMFRTNNKTSAPTYGRNKWPAPPGPEGMLKGMNPHAPVRDRPLSKPRPQLSRNIRRNTARDANPMDRRRGVKKLP